MNAANNSTTRVVRVARRSKTESRKSGTVSHYTRIVWALKRFLWALLVLMIVAVIWVASDDGSSKGGRIVFSTGLTSADETQPRMDKPHYQGIDENNQPYTITATQAVQKTANTVVMDDVTADMLQNDGKWIALKSKVGEYNTDERSLVLSGGISLFADGGFEFRTKEAIMHMKTGITEGNSHIEGQGAPGIITADRFTMDNKQHIIRFNGSVRMILYP
ncbi:MAG: LPS export ABC transporter periplasmic protein LptC [Rickettsiales bacterium]|nr:LPS export ABC transporter periplasmic protein LptC [Rickettsiales bacterium]